PDIVLVDDLHVGSCWRFKGTSGQLGIVLPVPVIISHITVDHVSRKYTPLTNLALRTIIIWGVVDAPENLEKLERRTANVSAKLTELIGDRSGPPITGHFQFTPLAIFDYDIHANSHIQTFPLLDDILGLKMDFGVVVVEIVDNWGSEAWTCLHRVRIHGEQK
ncbi:hypothetical protein BV22DRAFT_1023447, partial [Leucogyrophana mollusca]